MTAVARLGYLGFEVADPVQWQSFAVDVLGLSSGEPAPDGSLSLRMDDQAQRIALHRGASDDLAYGGFEVEDARALDALAAKLAGGGVTVREGDAAARAARRVGALLQLEDPNGLPLELYCSPARAREPFRSALVPDGFCTGDEGLGHIVIGARDAEATRRFYCDLLGMRVSDHIEVPGGKLRITFLHANARHHSLAFFAAPTRKRINHFMIEAQRMEDVGLCYERCVAARIPIANGLGQHPNDRMFSFYAVTPAGFNVEFGWGGRKVDDARWQVATYDRMSTWGHQPAAKRSA
jgi:biphenyl-2,3-diol 1,2-dioxygenase/3,4-dihydroxy-9,10-secoandrosta-1,3,5(10)-triene-9,17-dione 4,5-dioxygenase